MSLSNAILRQLLSAPMSLADLQLATQVSLPTLRRAVQELTEGRWIRIVGQAETNGGRPAMLFGPDDTHYMLIGVHLQLPGVRLISTNLDGTVMGEEKKHDRVVPIPEEVVLALIDYVAQTRTNFPDRAVLGIGIAAPGFIDPITGDIISIGRVPGWESFPICRRLEKMLGLPVVVANDVDCMAFSEFQYRHEPLDKNLAYVGYDEGVKASLVLNGELYKGSLGNAGLIASHLLHVGGELRPSDVQSLLTVLGIDQRFQERVGALDVNEQRPYAHLMELGNPRERFRQILNCSSPETAICGDITEELIVAMAATVANIVFFYQPEVVVIGGLLTAMAHNRFAELEAAIRGTCRR